VQTLQILQSHFAEARQIIRRYQQSCLLTNHAQRTFLAVSDDRSNDLSNAKTILIETNQYDVFGDDSVVIKFAPGHTPGHQMLLLGLKNTGPVLLAQRLVADFD